MTLILASRSPRRQDLLSLFGLPFTVSQADIDETPLASESPEEMTARLARAKAEHIYSLCRGSPWVLGGDTTVTIDDQILGKPASVQEAMEMLQLLSGRTHQVMSAISLVGEGFHETRVNTSDVTFDTLSERRIKAYCDSGEPFDKAGGYGIQGLAGAWVTELRGSYSGVMGMPLLETRLLLEQSGLLS